MNRLKFGAFLAPQFITYFAVAGRLLEYAKNGLRAATTVLTPAVSAFEARGETGAIRDVMAGTETKLNEAAARDALNGYQKELSTKREEERKKSAEKNKKDGEQWLAGDGAAGNRARASATALAIA